jgi:hypothetical protein
MRIASQAPAQSRPARRTSGPVTVEERAVDPANPYSGLRADADFEAAPMEVAAATVLDGTILVGTPQQPLIAIAQRGRGQITLLHFNPELKPFLNWKNRSHF